jgi:hypothetical protein
MPLLSQTADRPQSDRWPPVYLSSRMHAPHAARTNVANRIVFRKEIGGRRCALFSFC